MLKYVFGAIFIALAWALALVFRELVPLWTAILVTALIVGGLAALAIFRLLAARRAASAIEKGLGDQAQHLNAGMRPDLQAEIAAMQAEFQRAVQALKSSKLGRNGRDALGLLPWYVIIGPPGAGKTTAIRSSGLKFPSGKGGVVRGVGGTRNCDWWMTNEAILLDTAGRWSTEDDDREEWLAFLDLLKRTRPKKPVNGILLAISATELQKGEDDIGTLAQGLRERIDEVIARLDMVVPVYLLVTKCDLLSGFVECFGDLKDRDRGQIWGFTLPLVSEHADHVDAFAQHFDDLTEVVERFSVLRMGEERRIEARERIYAFPQQFDSLRQGLIDLVANLFDQSVYQDGPIMRGVYFSSGTQEGRPVDRVMASMAAAFGVRPRIEAAPPTKPKSYFVRDLFQKVIFPDRDVAVSSTRVLRRQRLVRWASAAGALVVSIAFLVLPISSYLENKQFIADARGFVEKLARARSEHDNPGPLAAAALEAAEPMATRLASFETKGPDVSLRFGLYPGARLMDPLHLAVERLVIRPILTGDAERLAAFSRGRGDLDASGAESGLMLHLLLTQPKASDEPAPEGDSWAEWTVVAAQQMSDHWASMAGDAGTSHAKHTVAESTRFYMAGVDTSSDLIERSSVVSRTRTALLGATDGDPLADLLRDPSLPRDVRLIDIVGGAITSFQTVGDQKSAGPSVPGAFTPGGWKIVQARIQRLTSESKDDKTAWVLGVGHKRTTSDAATLQAAYFRRYVEAWKTFLLSLSVKEPTNIDEVRSLLGSLIREKPLDAIWRNAGKELQFKDDSPLAEVVAKGKSGFGDRIDEVRKKLGVGTDDGAEASAQRRGKESTDDPTSPEDVGNQFAAFLNFGLTKPTGVDAYGQILAELSAAVGEQGTPDPKAFQATVKAQRVKLSNLIANYNDAGWEGPLLEKILMAPLRGAEVAVTGATGDSANRKWCDGIVVAYDQLLGGKYPFTTAKGSHEARVADIDKFFQPKTGTLWQYFSDTLQADIDHPTGTTVFHLKDQPSVKYKANLTDFLKRAQELTDLLYARDPAKIGVAAAIRIRPSAPYTKIVFEGGGRKVTYFNSKERWEDVTWPGRGALFRFYLKSGEGELGYTDGEWALFHLLEDGKSTATSDGEEYLAGVWSPPLGEGTIHADLKPAGLFHAFRHLEVPRSIVSGAGTCGR